MIKRFLNIGLFYTCLFSQQYKITHMEGTYDLDGDGFMEFASVESKTNGNKKFSVVRYYEIDDNGYQKLEWELESPDGLLSHKPPPKRPSLIIMAFGKVSKTA